VEPQEPFSCEGVSCAVAGADVLYQRVSSYSVEAQEKVTSIKKLFDYLKKHEKEIYDLRMKLAFLEQRRIMITRQIYFEALKTNISSDEGKEENKK